MLGTSYKEIKLRGYEYKGYIAESFVQQEFAAQGVEPSFSWNDARAEIEFIISNGSGQLVPIEVKSGKRTQAKSLQSYITKCQPHRTIKLTHRVLRCLKRSIWLCRCTLRSMCCSGLSDSPKNQLTHNSMKREVYVSTGDIRIKRTEGLVCRCRCGTSLVPT